MKLDASHPLGVFDSGLGGPDDVRKAWDHAMAGGRVRHGRDAARPHRCSSHGRLDDFAPPLIGERHEHHPLVALIQTLSDVTDPINYGHYWFSEPVDGRAVPIDILMTEGTEDQYTPPPTIEALAGSAGLPSL